MSLNQIGNSSPRFPLALLGQRADGWPRAEAGGLEALFPAAGRAADRLPTKIPLALLRRLITDDQLRTELEADPAETLRRQGIDAALEQVPAAVSLPSLQVLAGVLRLYATGEDESARLKWMAFLGGDD